MPNMPNMLDILSPKNSPGKFSRKGFSLARPALKTALVLTTASLMTIPQISFATNGMNLEGYGPVATGMGGTSMAYDNGTAAVMNNPATLGLMEDGESKLEVAIGTLGPNIGSSAPTGVNATDEDSSANLFLMPAVGYARKTNKLTYGFGVFSQGGMGTEYKNGGFMTGGTVPGIGDTFSGKTVRSEVGVGRLVFPLSYNVTPDLVIGGSMDVVWGGMDIQMDIGVSQFFDMVSPTANPNATQKFGSVGGSMMNAFFGAVGAGIISNGMGGNPPSIAWGRFDFSDGSDFTGAAGATGFAGKLGGVYKISSDFTIGATYHSKTSLSDMKASGAELAFNAFVDDNVLLGGAPLGVGYTATEIPISGKMRVKNFQWPETIAIGMISKDWMVATDLKYIGWSKVMKDFNMIFTADADQANPLAAGFAGTEMDVTLKQEWDDQTVLQLGTAYNVIDPLTLRFGLNLANNPVPDKYLNPLFPAIIRNHVTAGVGYRITKGSKVDFSLAYAPEVKRTSDYGQTTPGGEGVEVTHSQLNTQFMYTYVF